MGGTCAVTEETDEAYTSMVRLGTDLSTYLSWGRCQKGNNRRVIDQGIEVVIWGGFGRTP